MAYSHPSLQRVGPANSVSPTLWTYKTADAAAAVDTAGYFNAASADLTVGDFIFARTGSTSGIFVVLSNAAGVVDVGDAVAVGGTNTD